MKLYEFFKAKEEPKHQNLCVGEGVISLQDACIPLDNISAMEITLPPAMPFGLGIFFIIVGILELLIPYSVIRILGVLVLLIGIGYIFLIQYINQKRKYSLKITVNSGLRYGFESPNIEYMRNLLRLIQQAIDDRRIQFFADVTNTYINNDIKNVKEYFTTLIKEEYNVNISGGNNIFNSGIMGDLKDIVFGDKNTNTNSNVNTNIQTLSDEQWTTLIQFFENRAQNLEPNSEAYNSCIQMGQDAKRKDASALKQRIQSVGKEVFKVILGAGVSSVVKHLLELVIKA